MNIIFVPLQLVKKLVGDSMFSSIPFQEIPVPRIRIRELLARPPGKRRRSTTEATISPGGELGERLANGTGSDDSSSAESASSPAYGSGIQTGGDLTCLERAQRKSEQHGEVPVVPVAITATTTERTTMVAAPPPPIKGSESGADVLNGCDDLNKLSAGGGVDGVLSVGRHFSFFDEDDFDITFEDGEEGGETAPPAGGTSNSSSDLGVAAATPGALPAAPPPPKPPSPIPERQKSACPKKCRAKAVARRHNAVTAGRPSVANGRAGGGRESFDSGDEAALRLRGDEALLPRMSLKRDVKNEKRISYTTTKITGELSAGSSNSSKSSNSAQRRSESSVTPKSAVVSPLLRPAVDAPQQQNGGLSDCSTDSDRRFSERRFTGRGIHISYTP